MAKKQQALPGLDLEPAVKKRDTLTGRKVRRKIASAVASDALGPIEPGCEIFCMTMGKFSLIDVIEWVLEHTGPADLTLSTWSAAGADLGFAYSLMTNGSVRSCRILVDYSFETRQPAYCAAMREKFGDDAIRFSKNHAKFVLLRNDSWNIVIRTSMNLNENRRLETCEISDDADMADWLQEVVAAIFANQGETFGRNAYDHVKNFGRELGDFEAGEMADGDKRYFGDGPVDTDLRRVGISRRS